MPGALRPLSFDPEVVGRPVSGPAHVATAERLAAFALATNDGHPRHRSGELGPPAYAIVPVLSAMVAAKKLVTASFGFHGEHDFRFHEPIRPGMALHPVARVHGVHQRSSGVAITIRVETQGSERRLVNEQHFVSFVPGAAIDRDLGQAAPGHALPAEIGEREPLARVEHGVDADQARRFADASNDHDAYTLDEAAARAMGFPTTLLHGTCTLAFASRALIERICEGEPLRLRRFAARLTNPVYMIPGQSIVTTIWPGRAGAERIFHFQCVDAKGTMVITNGLAEIV